MENTPDGEYHGRACTVYGISNYRQTTHAYLGEEQQKLEGITATQIVGLSIRQNELTDPMMGRSILFWILVLGAEFLLAGMPF